MLTPQNIRQIANNYKSSIALAVAIKLDVFSAIEAGATTAEEVASNVNAAAIGIERLLNALTFMKLLSKDNEKFSNTEEASLFLVKGRPGYQGGYVKYTSDILSNWLNLEDAISDGSLKVEGIDEILGGNEEKTKSFIAAMNTNAMPNAKFVSETVDFTNDKRILDMGGGAATYSIAVAKKYPNIQATVVDLTPIANLAREYVNEAGLSNRVEVVDGDYSKDTWGDGYDSVFLFAVIHQEVPSTTLKMFKKARACLNDGGKLILSTFVLDDSKTSPPFSVMFGLELLVVTKNGYVYTAKEIIDLLSQAGFASSKIVDNSTGPATFIIATK